MDRRALLNRINTAWQDFTSSYVGLSDAALLESGVIGGWSIRDLIAHVTTWEEESLKYLPGIVEGRRPPRYSMMYGGIDAFNDLAMQRKRDLSLAEVLRQQDATHRRLLEFVEHVPEDQFVTDTLFRRRLRLDSYSHYREHAQAIREWRNQRIGQPLPIPSPAH